MKRLFYKFCPIIFALTGITMIFIDYLVDTFLPGHLGGYIWPIAGILAAVFGLTIGGLVKKLYSYGYTDALTGLRNRGYFYSKVNYEMKRAKRRRTSLSMLMIDVDNFKLVNDNYGHITGDKVLRQIAHSFVKKLGRRDIIARWGGEEFAVILPETSPELSYRIAEAIRHEIEACQQFHSICQGRVTISIGSATISSPMSVDDFVKMADRALYKAKERKNTVVSITSHLQEYRVSNL